MALYPVAGDHIYIGNTPMSDQAADFIASDFSGQSWTEIDGWSQQGSIGDAAALITTPLINRNRDVKQKGTANGGSMQNVFARIATDAGQLALIAAAAPSNKSNYAFRIDWSDGSKDYFIALAMNKENPGGSANTINMLNVTLEINSNLVSVAAP